MKHWIIVALAMLIGAGCMFAGKRQSVIYPMSYDQTYAAVLSAVDDLPDWRLVETDQLQGTLTFEAGGYLSFRRTTKIIVNRIAPFQTQVEIYRRKASICDQKFFDTIDRRVGEKALTYPR